jgi:hypothetical protein
MTDSPRQRAAAFRTAAYVFRKSGMNVWDARILARKLVGSSVPEPRVYARKQVDTPCSPLNVPTCDDILDINFRSIVSDCRGIIRGTLVPRSWCDISSTWSEQDTNNHGRYELKPDNSQVKQEKDRNRYMVRKMARILVMQGTSPLEAHIKAKTFLGVE